MKTVARLSAEDRSDLFRNTANRMQMSDAIVEKDFWVYDLLLSTGMHAQSISLNSPFYCDNSYYREK